MSEQGRVSLSGKEYHATCVLHMWGGDSRMFRVEVVIDTGFSGEVALPQRIVDQLSLVQKGSTDIRVADGRSANVKVYPLQIEWQGEFRSVEAICTDSFPLIGMALLSGSRLCVNVEEAGEVEITPIDQL